MTSIPILRGLNGQLVLTSGRAIPFLRPPAPVAFANGFFKRKVGVISKDFIKSAMTNMPIPFYVVDNDLKLKVNGGSVDNGKDFSLATTADVAIPLWIDKYNGTTGELWGYLLYASLANANDTFNPFRLYYGNANKSSHTNDTSIYGGAAAMWHLPSALDASPNNRPLSSDAAPANSPTDLGLGSAGYFDGTSGNVRTRDVTFLNGQNNITVMCKARIDEAASDRGLWQLNTDDLALRFVKGPSAAGLTNGLTARMRGANGLAVWSSANDVIGLGDKRHITVVYSPTTILVYIDGVLLTPRATVPAPGNFAPTALTAFQVGGGYGGYMNGVLDDMAIYTSGLSANEIFLHASLAAYIPDVVKFGAPETPGSALSPVSESIHLVNISGQVSIDMRRYIYHPSGGTISIQSPLPSVAGLTFSAPDATTLVVEATTPGTYTFTVNVSVV